MKFLQKYTGELRRMKFGYWVYNLLKYNKLKANKNQYTKLGIEKQVWQSINHADITNPAIEKPWLDGKVSNDDIKKKDRFYSFPETIQHKILAWPQKGYLILEQFFTNEEVDAVNTDIEIMLQQKKLDFNFTGRKIMDAWQTSGAVSRVLKHQKLMELLSFLLGKEVIPFQTINFQKGSEQKPHSDSIHMTTEPLGYLIATWTALENIDDGAGLLVYYPGSHRLKYILGEDFETGHSLWQLGAETYPNYEEKIASVIAQNNFTAQYFKAKKGDVLIWHANLLHGGTPITDPNATRKSQVCHYYAKDVLCYHEISQRPAILK